MISNLDKYKKDLELLIERGNSLYLALSYEQDKPGFEKLAKKKSSLRPLPRTGKFTAKVSKHRPAQTPKRRSLYQDHKNGD